MTPDDATRPVALTRADEGEETARADLYGVLATLYAAPPTAVLLTTLASVAAAGDSVLAQAWRGLSDAARAALEGGAAVAQERVRAEYERLFIGVGKPEVLLYGSFYLSGFLMEKPLAALRTDLMRLGLERADDVCESEDHIASLCEVMRYLIAAVGEGDDRLGEDTPPRSEAARLIRQKIFFATHLQPWAGDLCGALMAHRHAVFYRAVAQLTQVFFEVEAEAFEFGVAA